MWFHLHEILKQVTYSDSPVVVRGMEGEQGWETEKVIGEWLQRGMKELPMVIKLYI